jgi:hypothetical protein
VPACQLQASSRQIGQARTAAASDPPDQLVRLLRGICQPFEELRAELQPRPQVFRVSCDADACHFGVVLRWL